MSIISVEPNSIGIGREGPDVRKVVLVVDNSGFANSGRAKEELDNRDGLINTGVEGKGFKTRVVLDEDNGIFVDDGTKTTVLDELGRSLKISPLPLLGFSRSTKEPGAFDTRLLLGAVIDSLLLTTSPTLPMKGGKELLKLTEALRLVELDVALEVLGGDLLPLAEEELRREDFIELLRRKRRIVKGK